MKSSSLFLAGVSLTTAETLGFERARYRLSLVPLAAKQDSRRLENLSNLSTFLFEISDTPNMSMSMSMPMLMSMSMSYSYPINQIIKDGENGSDVAPNASWDEDNTDFDQIEIKAQLVQNDVKVKGSENSNKEVPWRSCENSSTLKSGTSSFGTVSLLISVESVGELSAMILSELNGEILDSMEPEILKCHTSGRRLAARKLAAHSLSAVTTINDQEHCSVTVSGATRCTVLATELAVVASTDEDLDTALRLAVENIDYNSKVGTYEDETIRSVTYLSAEQEARSIQVATIDDSGSVEGSGNNFILIAGLTVAATAVLAMGVYSIKRRIANYGCDEDSQMGGISKASSGNVANSLDTDSTTADEHQKLYIEKAFSD